MRPSPRCDATTLGAPPEVLANLRTVRGRYASAATNCTRADHLVFYLALANEPLPKLLASVVPSLVERAGAAGANDSLLEAFSLTLGRWTRGECGHAQLQESLNAAIRSVVPDSMADPWLNALGDVVFATSFVEADDGNTATTTCSSALERAGFALSGVPAGELSHPAYLAAQATLARELRKLL